MSGRVREATAASAGAWAEALTLRALRASLPERTQQRLARLVESPLGVLRDAVGGVSRASSRLDQAARLSLSLSPAPTVMSASSRSRASSASAPVSPRAHEEANFSERARRARQREERAAAAAAKEAAEEQRRRQLQAVSESAHARALTEEELQAQRANNSSSSSSNSNSNGAHSAAVTAERARQLQALEKQVADLRAELQVLQTSTRNARGGDDHDGDGEADDSDDSVALEHRLDMEREHDRLRERSLARARRQRERDDNRDFFYPRERVGPSGGGTAAALPEFSGQPTPDKPGASGAMFLKLFSQARRIGNWSSERASFEFLRALRGRAADWASLLPATTSDDIDKLLSAFRQRFVATANVARIIDDDSVLARLRNCRQGSMPVAAFAQQFVELAVRADIDVESTLAKTFFVDALNHELQVLVANIADKPFHKIARVAAQTERTLMAARQLQACASGSFGSGTTAGGGHGRREQHEHRRSNFFVGEREHQFERTAGGGAGRRSERERDVPAQAAAGGRAWVSDAEYRQRLFCDFCQRPGHSTERCKQRQAQAMQQGTGALSGANLTPLGNGSRAALGPVLSAPTQAGASSSHSQAGTGTVVSNGGTRSTAAVANTAYAEDTISSCDVASAFVPQSASMLAPSDGHFEVVARVRAHDAPHDSAWTLATTCIDSGAALSLVDAAWLEANFPALHNAACVATKLAAQCGVDTRPLLRTATGEAVTAFGVVVLATCYATTDAGEPIKPRLVKFIIANLSTAFNVIIGMNELAAAGAVIDIRRHEVRVSGAPAISISGGRGERDDSAVTLAQHAGAENAVECDRATAVAVSDDASTSHAEHEQLPRQPTVSSLELTPSAARRNGRAEDNDKLCATAVVTPAFEDLWREPSERARGKALQLLALSGDAGAPLTTDSARFDDGCAFDHVPRAGGIDVTEFRLAAREFVQSGAWCALGARVQSQVTQAAEQGEAAVREAEELTEWFTRFAHVFAPHGKHPGCTALVEHSIVLQPGAIPVRRKPYRVAFADEQKQREEIGALLESKIIRPSASPFAAPTVRVRKADGTTRTCVDYTALNASTIKDRYPMPAVDDILPRLHGARVFSSIDLSMGYYQVRMRAEDIPKTAFVTPFGQYEFVFMPFGLCNAPATFQRLMDHVLVRFIGVCAFVYLDDIVVFSNSEVEHKHHLESIFEALDGANLHLNARKCRFFQPSIKFLGHVVDGSGVHTDADKCRAVASFPTPTSADGVRRFLGMAGYYRRFIRGFADKAAPLTALLGKRAPFVWSQREQAAFDGLREALTSADVLAYPEFGAKARPFILTTDASAVGLGAVLSQRQSIVLPSGASELAERPIAFASRLLCAAERNYSATQRELLGVIYGVEKFREYLFGKRFQVVTDHQALSWLLHLKEPSGRLARWALALGEYEFDIAYRAGRAIPHADALSRVGLDGELPAEQAVQEDAFDGSALTEAAQEQAEHAVAVVAVTAEVATGVAAVAGPAVSTSAGASSSHEKFVAAQRADEELALYFRYLEHGELPAEELKAREVVALALRMVVDADSGALYLFESANAAARYAHARDAELDDRERARTRFDEAARRLVVPRLLQARVLAEHHEVALAGHLGVNKTAAAIHRKFFWPALYADVREFVRSCQVCAEAKSPTTRKAGRLQPLQSSFPWELVAVDVLGPLTTSTAGNRYIVVFADHFTKWVEAFAVARADAATTARLFVDEIICRHGAPQKLLSDRGSNFLSSLVKEVNALFRVKKLTTSAYHPQTDGLVERFNKTLAAMLRSFVTADQLDWDVYLPAVLFAYRRTVQPSIDDTPFALLYGRDPVAPLDVEWPVELPVARVGPRGPLEWRDGLFRRVREQVERARGALERARAEQQRRYDAEHRNVSFAVGQLVMVFNPAVPVGMSRKLVRRWRGPFRVRDKIRDQAYVLQGLDGSVVPSPVHVLRLKPFVTRLTEAAAGVADGGLQLDAAVSDDIGPVEQLAVEPADEQDRESIDGGQDATSKQDVFDGADVGAGEVANSATGARADHVIADIDKELADDGDVFDEPDVYRVEQILARRTKRRGRARAREYLVRWSGFDDSHNTWEPASNILDEQLIADFEAGTGAAERSARHNRRPP